MRKYLIRTLSILCVVVAMALLLPSEGEAAKKTVCDTLKPNKTYKYNLDKKGKQETIKYTVIKNEIEDEDYYFDDYDYEVEVTINGKAIYKKTFNQRYEVPISVMVLDVDKKDKQLEVFIIEGEQVSNRSSWTSDMKNIYYYQYKNGKATQKQNLSLLIRKQFKSVCAIHGVNDKSYLTTNGKGVIYLRVCVKMKTLDFHHIKVNLNLKNGKFVKSSKKEYELFDGDDLYELKKSVKVTIKPGGGKVAFTAKAKEFIRPVAYYKTSKGKAYLKIVTDKGKKGYIDPTKVKVEEGTKHVGW